jgi:hypothetical protein
MLTTCYLLSGAFSLASSHPLNESLTRQPLKLSKPARRGNSLHTYSFKYGSFLIDFPPSISMHTYVVCCRRFQR